ncbi:MAG: ethylbenzene dehydrogenase-related protein [Acidimicrobiales bacterium]
MTIHAVRAERGSAQPQPARWPAVKPALLALTPVPLDAQPNAYIRAKWADRPYGTVPEVRVKVACDDDTLHVELDWEDPAPEPGEFPDAAAVFFPADASAPAQTIGAEEHPVTMWYWRSDASGGQVVKGSGPGVFFPLTSGGQSAVSTDAALAEGRWTVGFTGPMAFQTATPKVGVAVWNGTNQERAGLAAVTAEWVPVELPG